MGLALCCCIALAGFREGGRVIKALVCSTPADAAVTYRPRMVAPQFRFPAWLAGGELAVATFSFHVLWMVVDAIMQLVVQLVD
jgi:hypothetical protein